MSHLQNKKTPPTFPTSLFSLLLQVVEKTTDNEGLVKFYLPILNQI